MLRLAVWFGVVVLFLASSAMGFCQTGLPAFGINACGPQSRVAPVTRTVQVSVPMLPGQCRPLSSLPPRPCGFGCPSPPTQPVNVRVEVVVRPEAPQPCVPQRFCFENPPIFEPFFCQLAGLVRSLIVAPLGLGEAFMGHPVVIPCVPPTPICPPHFQPPVAPCMAPCPPAVRCALPEPPTKVRPPWVCGPSWARPQPPRGPFPR